MNCLEDNAIHYVAGYLLRKVLLWHNCNACDKIFNGSDSGYLKINEMFTKFKKYSDNSGLVNVSQAFHYYIVRLEKALQSVVSARIHEGNIAKILLSELSKLRVPTPCTGFPKIKFTMFYIRLRLYYILKYANREVVSKRKKTKIYKQFAHV